MTSDQISLIIRDMRYHKTTLAILAIIFITQSGAEVDPRLEIYSEFLRVILLHLKTHYESIRKTAVPSVFSDKLNSQESEVYALGQSTLDEYEEKFRSAVNNGQSIESSRASLISGIKEAKNKTIIALGECVTKNKPDLDVYDVKFRELISMGTDYQERIKKVNDECEAQPVAFKEECVDLKISQMSEFERHFKLDSMKLRKNFEAAVHSATIVIQNCYSDVMREFDITLSNIKLNCEKSLTNYVVSYYP